MHHYITKLFIDGQGVLPRDVVTMCDMKRNLFSSTNLLMVVDKITVLVNPF